jgi:hypothetical protein
MSEERFSEPFAQRLDTALMNMGIIARLFQFRRDESTTAHDGFEWNVEDRASRDRAVLEQIAANDEDPDVRRAARELMESDYSFTRD